MNDFITMQCPNCGGNLSVGANSLRVKCEYCSVEHIIRREASGIILESYARCPVCNRNDRAEKVTAILRSQTQNIEGVTYQPQTVMEQIGKKTILVNKQVAVSVKTSQMSDLAKHLVFPSCLQTNNITTIKDNTSHAALIGAIASAVVGLFCTMQQLAGFLIVSDSNTALENFLLFIIRSIIPLTISAILFFFVVPREQKINIKKKAAAENERLAIERQSADKEKQLQIAKHRWNMLYYCGRDDCVFLPGTNTYAPIAEMGSYLFKP